MVKITRKRSHTRQLWIHGTNKVCRHEPCLYYHSSYKGQDIYFIRQIDDFVIDYIDRKIADDLISIINKKMTNKIKHLGIMKWLNGVGIGQTRHYIKINDATYFEEILENEKQLSTNPHTYPLLMNSEPTYNRSVQDTIRLSDEERTKIDEEFGFIYHQDVGVLIYGMVTCRPDILFLLIKLSQCSASLATINFASIQGIFDYTRAIHILQHRQDF